MKSLLLTCLIVCVVVLVSVSVLKQPHSAFSLSRIERVETLAAREQGLSGRASIPEDYGMLFVSPVKSDNGFWMKDMLVSIDIIWLADDGTIIGIEHSLSPDSYPTIFHPPIPVRYVLEIRAGTASERGWSTGTVLTLPIP